MEPLVVSKVVNALAAADPTYGQAADRLIHDYTSLATKIKSSEFTTNGGYESGLSTGQYVWLREQLLCEWSLQSILASIGKASVFAGQSLQHAKAFVALFSAQPTTTATIRPVLVRDDRERVYLFENMLVKRWRQTCLTCEKPAALRCGGCQRAWFCTNECQQRIWPIHKPSCKPLSTTIHKLGKNLFNRLISLSCPPPYQPCKATPLPLLIGQDNNDDSDAEATPEEEQMYARLFVRRLHKWEEAAEARLLLGLAQELLQTIQLTDGILEDANGSREDAKCARVDAKGSVVDAKGSVVEAKRLEEDRTFLLRNCVEIASKIQELGVDQEEPGLFVCVEWGVMLPTCPELAPLIRSQQLPDHTILVEFRSMERLAAMRISERNRQRIMQIADGEMCLGIATTNRPAFRIVVLPRHVANALRNASLLPHQIIAAFQSL